MLLLSEPKAPGGLTFATGQASTFLDVVDAAQENTRYAWNSDSYKTALEEAYDRRIAAVKEATGQTLDNPMRALPSADDYRQMASRWRAGGRPVHRFDFLAEQFQTTLARIAESNPDKLGVLRPHVSVLDDARAIARTSEAKLGDVISRASGLDAVAGNLVGGFAGSFEDPLTIPTMAVGFAGNAAKSLLWNALRAAASNAAGQAIVEPFIQQWRAEAGLEAGILPGLKDIAFAGAVGGGLDLGVRGLVRGGKLATGANLAPPPAIERGATIEDAIPRLPDDNPIKAAAKGDTAALVTAVQKIEGHLTPTERGALRALEDDTGMKIDAGEDLAAVAQALRHAEDPIAEPLPVHEPDPAPVAPAKADAAPSAPDAPVDDVATRLSEGRGSAIETAAAFRARPELIASMPLEGKARTARSLARLSDPAFEMVQQQGVKPEWGALVGDLVADPAEHVPVLQRLSELRPETVGEARRIIAEETVKPATPKAVETMLGGSSPTRAEATLHQVAAAIRAGVVPAKRAREALKRRIESGEIDADAGPAPVPRGLDEPAGPEAKAHVEAMLKERKSRLGKGLKDITAEQKGGQAAVDRVAGRGGKPKFSLSGLDLSPEARKARAEAQGFDTSRVWYHGTHADFAAFDVSKADAVYGRAIYLAETPEVSSRFAKRDGGRLLQLYVKRGNYFDPMSADGQEALKRFVMDERQGRHIDGVPAEKILKWAAEGDTQTLQYEPIQEWMKKKGYDGWFEIEGVDGGPRSLAVFDPSSIRSTSAAFDPGNAGRNGLLFSLSPAAAAAMPDVRVKLNEIAATLPKAVRIRLYDRLTFSDLPAHIQRTAPPGVEAKTIQGLWDPEQMVIHLALSTADPVATLRHEQVHMMRALGLLSDDDYRRLVRHAEKTGARKTYKIDATYGATIKAQHADKIAREAVLVEETVAHLVADRLTGKTIGGGLDKVLKPVRDFLRKVRDALGLKGFRTVEDVFAEIGAPKPTSAPKGDVFFSLAPDDAEAALGVRLGEAELRGKVGAAARKLAGNVEMQAAWIEGMGLEAGDAEEIVKLYHGFLKDFSALMDESTAKRLARDHVADLLETEALQRKRVALLQLEATTRAREVLSTHKNARGEVDPAQAMIGMLEHYGLEGTPITSSVEGRRKAILGRAHAQMEEVLWNFRKTGGSGRRMNRAQMPNVVRELFGEGTGDAAAKAFAKAWTDTADGLAPALQPGGRRRRQARKMGPAAGARRPGAAQARARCLEIRHPAAARSGQDAPPADGRADDGGTGERQPRHRLQAHRHRRHGRRRRDGRRPRRAAQAARRAPLPRLQGCRRLAQVPEGLWLGRAGRRVRRHDEPRQPHGARHRRHGSARAQSRA